MIRRDESCRRESLQLFEHFERFIPPARSRVSRAESGQHERAAAENLNCPLRFIDSLFKSSGLTQRPTVAVVAHAVRWLFMRQLAVFRDALLIAARKVVAPAEVVPVVR